LGGAPSPSLSRANGRSNDATQTLRQAALATPSLPAASTSWPLVSHVAWGDRPDPHATPSKKSHVCRHFRTTRGDSGGPRALPCASTPVLTGVSAKWRDPDSNRGHHDFQLSASGREKLSICRPFAGRYTPSLPLVAWGFLWFWAGSGASPAQTPTRPVRDGERRTPSEPKALRSSADVVASTVNARSLTASKPSGQRPDNARKQRTPAGGDERSIVVTYRDSPEYGPTSGARRRDAASCCPWHLL
jgi:hypothetical protein